MTTNHSEANLNCAVTGSKNASGQTIEDNKVITYEEMLVKSHQEKVNEDVNIKENNNIIENDDIKVTDSQY